MPIKMKLRLSRVIKALVYLVFLLDSSFLMLTYINNNIKIYGMLFIAFLSLAIIGMYKSCRRKIKGSLGIIKHFALVLILMVFIHGVYAIAINDVPVDIFLRNAGYYLIFFLTYSLLYVFETDGGSDIFWRNMTAVSVIWFFWLILQFVVYSRNETVISPYLNGAGYESIRLRNGNLRIEMRVIAHLVILFNFNKFYNQKANQRRYINLFVSILGCITMVLVEQTRGYFLAIFLSMISILLSGIKSMKKFLSSMIVLVIVGIFLYETQIVSNTFNTVMSSDTTNRLATGFIRFEGMRVFWHQFLKNPFLGFGFQRTGDYVIVSGWPYYFNDDGLIGIVGQIGIWAFIIYIIMFMRQLYILIKLKRADDKAYDFSLLMSLFMYFVLTSPSLICFWNSTCLLCPIIWALFEYEYAQLLNRNMLNE